jgi:hypothetical protein
MNSTDNKSETRRQLESAFQALRALAEIIRHADEVPSGELYARLMGRVTLEDYTRLIETLKRTGLVTETPGHLLRWTGPKNLGTTPENNNHQPKGIRNHG